MNAETIRREIVASAADMFALCGALVEAESAQPIGDTRGPANVLMGWLGARGLSPEIRAAVPEKPNVVCRIGSGRGRTLGFNGHLDTLPAGDGWTIPALALTRAGDRLHGLGVGNMKAGVAALATAFAALARHPNLWNGNIVLTTVADEVVFGPHGAEWLLRDDPSLLGDALINGEGPGDMGLAVAEKGLLWIELVARGPAGQGMLATRGASPVLRLAETLAVIDGWNDETATAPDEIACVGASAGAHRLRLSVNIGTVGGGELTSQIPTEVRATVDLRIPPGLTLSYLEHRIAATVSSRPGLSWRRIKGWDANWTPTDASIAQVVAQAAAALRGAAAPPVVRLPASDASRWRARGIPAVSYGPQPLLASGPNDWVREEDVMDCAQVYAAAALAYLSC